MNKLFVFVALAVAFSCVLALPAPHGGHYPQPHHGPPPPPPPPKFPPPPPNGYKGPQPPQKEEHKGEHHEPKQEHHEHQEHHEPKQEHHEHSELGSHGSEQHEVSGSEVGSAGQESGHGHSQVEINSHTDHHESITFSGKGRTTRETAEQPNEEAFQALDVRNH